MSAKKMLVASGFMAVTFLTACNLNSNREPDYDAYAVSTVNALDARFLQNATEMNTAEIMMSNIALTHYRHDSVQIFASMMVAEHSNLQSQLNSIGTKVNVETHDDEYLSPMNTVLYDSLRKEVTTGGKSKTRELDIKYLEIQKAMHEKAITLFRAEANNGGGNADIVRFANSNIAKLEAHHKMADDILKKLR